MKLNRNYDNLQESYLFSTVARKAREFAERNPNADVIKLSIGDVTRPLAPVVVEAMKNAAAEMGKAETFRGYGPEQGYDFLKEAIADYYRKEDGVTLDLDEIFISDGAKSDLGNILDLFDADNTVLIPDPVYPVYVDTNLMAGRRIVMLNCTAENGFTPMPDEGQEADLIYLCSPNNPTGAVYNRGQLKKWVDFANENHALILFDAAYECFIQSPDLPRSIYEIDGAKSCAIEFCSLSKTAGFTGTRCGYTVVPKALVFGGVSLNKMWLRRQTTKFNGVSYIVQKGAAAVFSKEGRQQIEENIAYYMENAKVIAKGMDALGVWYTGGENSPYIWLKCPNGMESWDFFDALLTKANVVGTPGAGFGENGKYFFRLTAFGDKDATKEAVKRILDVFKA